MLQAARFFSFMQSVNVGFTMKHGSETLISLSDGDLAVACHMMLHRSTPCLLGEQFGEYPHRFRDNVSRRSRSCYISQSSTHTHRGCVWELLYFKGCMIFPRRPLPEGSRVPKNVMLCKSEKTEGQVRNGCCRVGKRVRKPAPESADS